MATTTEPKARPALLQLNNSGAWKTVCSFDASIALDTDLAHTVAESVCMLDAKARWRIVTDTPHPIVLRHCDKANGWRDA